MRKQITDNTSIQGSDEWLKARLGFRNASETPDVMGVGFNKPNKLKRIKAGLDTVFVNNAMKRGNELEDQVREWAEEELGQMFSASVWENGKYRASLDGLSFDQSLLIEIKVSDYTFNKIKDGGVPENYKLQMIHQMYCSPAEKGFLVAYSPVKDEYVVSDLVEFDFDLWEKVQTEWAKFDAMAVPDEDYIELDSKEYFILDLDYAATKKIIDGLNSDLKDIKNKMEKIADGRSVRGLYTSINTSVRKGSVNYKKVIKDNNISFVESDYKNPDSKITTIRIRNAPTA